MWSMSSFLLVHKRLRKSIGKNFSIAFALYVSFLLGRVICQNINNFLYLRSGGSVQGHGNGQVQVPIPMPYPPQMMHMPVFGMAHGNGHLGMPMGNPATPGSYHGFESYPYSMVPQRDWSGNKFGSFASYQHVTPNDK